MRILMQMQAKFHEDLKYRRSLLPRPRRSGEERVAYLHEVYPKLLHEFYWLLPPLGEYAPAAAFAAAGGAVVANTAPMRAGCWPWLKRMARLWGVALLREGGDRVHCVGAQTLSETFTDLITYLHEVASVVAASTPAAPDRSEQLREIWEGSFARAYFLMLADSGSNESHPRVNIGYGVFYPDFDAHAKPNKIRHKLVELAPELRAHRRPGGSEEVTFKRTDRIGGYFAHNAGVWAGGYEGEESNNFAEEWGYPKRRWMPLQNPWKSTENIKPALINRRWFKLSPFEGFDKTKPVDPFMFDVPPMVRNGPPPTVAPRTPNWVSFATPDFPRMEIDGTEHVAINDVWVPVIAKAPTLQSLREEMRRVPPMSRRAAAS
ncbi:hypothetical protein D6827_02060 [Candidatus Parcubacteria bacterium]|nr:MAG: hypothetical protein D6827_02060 [Candidatus Parcubacteria bacterium]